MLGKLMKYDLKMFFQTCGSLYLIGTILAIGNGILVLCYEPLSESFIMQDAGFSVSTSISSGIWKSMLATVLIVGILAIAAILPVAVILIISRFYKGVFGQEGYLTNTLPVTEHEIVLSKLGAAMITGLVTFVVYFLQMLLFLSISTRMEIYSTFSYIRLFMEDIDLADLPWIASIVFGVISWVSNLLLVYLAIAIGHLFRHRLLMSVVIYYGINYVIVQPLALLTNFSYLFSPEQGGFEWMILANSIILGILSVGYYFGIIWIMKRKLNLV